MTPDLLSITWRPRGSPLTPCAVAATGKASLALARRLLARDDAAIRSLQGIAGAELLVVLGPESDLPWVDGAQFFGQTSEAPLLFMPTHSMPSVPAGLLQLALTRTHAETKPPVLVQPQPPRLLSLVAARPIDRGVLEQWLRMQEGA